MYRKLGQEESELVQMHQLIKDFVCTNLGQINPDLADQLWLARPLVQPD